MNSTKPLCSPSPLASSLAFHSSPVSLSSNLLSRFLLVAVFEYLNCKVEWYIKEGAEITQKTKIATVTGPIRNILMGERTALNIITRCSGISTEVFSLSVYRSASPTRWSNSSVPRAGTVPFVLLERPLLVSLFLFIPTLSGFRLVEKYAVLVGGAATHRMDLSSMVMLKGTTPFRLFHSPRQPRLGNWFYHWQCSQGQRRLRIQLQDRGRSQNLRGGHRGCICSSPFSFVDQGWSWCCHVGQLLSWGHQSRRWKDQEGVSPHHPGGFWRMQSAWSTIYRASLSIPSVIISLLTLMSSLWVVWLRVFALQRVSSVGYPCMDLSLKVNKN